MMHTAMVLNWNGNRLALQHQRITLAAFGFVVISINPHDYDGASHAGKHDAIESKQLARRQPARVGNADQCHRLATSKYTKAVTKMPDKASPDRTFRI